MRASTAPLVAPIIAALFAIAAASAQAPDPPLPAHVSTIKVNDSGSTASSTRRLPGGVLLANNMTLRDMIAFSQSLQPFQIEDGPDWIGQVRFDVTIKTETNIGPAAVGPSQVGLQVLRAVLAERFSFKAHRETRERPVFALVRARQDGSLGPQLRQSATDCAALARDAGTSGAPWPPRSANGRLLCGLNTQGMPVTAGGYPMSEFLRYLTTQTHRAVIDRTGLTGAWDFELTFVSTDVGATADRTGPSLFTALQEQLGLRLDATRGPAEVLVIDRVERPTPD
jgi:uncharacterized protein (TIGR03435 family)